MIEIKHAGQITGFGNITKMPLTAVRAMISVKIATAPLAYTTLYHLTKRVSCTFQALIRSLIQTTSAETLIFMTGHCFGLGPVLRFIVGGTSVAAMIFSFLHFAQRARTRSMPNSGFAGPALRNSWSQPCLSFAAFLRVRVRGAVFFPISFEGRGRVSGSGGGGARLAGFTFFGS